MKKIFVSATMLAGIQWLFFMFANTVVIPLTIGEAFHLQASEVSVALQRSFIYTGAACVLQAWLGHKYPLMEGQSGLWWGSILSICASATAAGMNVNQLGGELSVGIILSGVMIAIFGALGIGRVLNRLFTPVVMSVVLFLLASQLITIFLKGMLGLTDGKTINIPVALLSFALAIFVVLLNIRGTGMLRSFSILIGICTGWLIYSLFFPLPKSVLSDSPGMITLFPWGKPGWNIGVILMALVTGLVNTTNTMAAIRGVEPLLKKETSDAAYRRSFVLTGINSVVSGIFGFVPYAPYISSIGFLQTTRILERAPFIFGGLLFSLMGLVPAMGTFFSTLPVSVGDAVLFVAYLQLFGGALVNLNGISFTSKTIYRIAVPVLTGLGIMNIRPQMFDSIPMLIRPLVSNGLVMGILLAVILEQLTVWERVDKIGLHKAT